MKKALEYLQEHAYMTGDFTTQREIYMFYKYHD